MLELWCAYELTRTHHGVPFVSSLLKNDRDKYTIFLHGEYMRTCLCALVAGSMPIMSDLFNEFDTRFDTGTPLSK